MKGHSAAVLPDGKQMSGGTISSAHRGQGRPAVERPTLVMRVEMLQPVRAQVRG